MVVQLRLVPGQVYRVAGVKFDTYANGVLIEAKGPSYANFIKEGELQRWFTGKQRIIEQARQQAKAARGFPVEWHVADEEAIPVFRKLLDDAGVPGVEVIYTPAGAP